MTVILEPCTLADLNLNEDDPRFISVERIFDEERCYVTPITVTEVYRQIRDGISTQRAEMMLESALSGKVVAIADDANESLIRAVIQVRDMGVPYPIAFCAALSKSMGVEILTNEPVYDRLAEAGLCTVRHY